MIITAKVVGQPEVLVEGPLGDVYAWKFRMPMLVTFWQPPYDDNSSFQNAWVVNVIIKRESILQSVDGLGILQLLITAASPKDIPAPGGSS